MFISFPNLFQMYCPDQSVMQVSSALHTIYIRSHINSRGKFNNASALGRSLYWCQALHIMNKDRYQSTSARRALALLNSPQVGGRKCFLA